MRKSSRFAQLVLWSVALFCLPHFPGGATPAHGQVAVSPSGVAYPRWRRRSHWGYYNVADVISSRVHAQADLVRAQGDAILNIETARRIRQETISKSIDNYVKRIDAQLEVRHKREAEELRRLYKPIKNRKQLNMRLWERYKNLPEMNYAAIPDGRGLNFLLHRLSGTVLSYEFAGTPGSDSESRSKFYGLDLSAERLGNINLIQRASGGRGNTFKASQGVGINVDWWPWELRQKTFDYQRKQFEAARKKIVEEARGGKISTNAISSLDGALKKLQSSFDEYFTRDVRYRDGFRSWREYNRAKIFLKGLAGEVGRLRHTGDPRAFAGKFRFEGDNLIDLLTYMSRHGFEFAPATPGREDHYHAVFKMMRDVYITVADRDTSLGKKPME